MGKKNFDLFYVLQFRSSMKAIPRTIDHPDSFSRLTSEELDCLWQCLANDRETSDDFFSWLLRQVKCKEQHALDGETLKHLYTKLMPSLAPEDMSMVALSLLQQLCNMSRAKESPMKQNSDVLAMELLWKIALRAHNTGLYQPAAVQSQFTVRIINTIVRFFRCELGCHAIHKQLLHVPSTRTRTGIH